MFTSVCTSFLNLKKQLVLQTVQSGPFPLDVKSMDALWKPKPEGRQVTPVARLSALIAQPLDGTATNLQATKNHPKTCLLTA